MKPASELYPDASRDYGFYVSDYWPILNAIGTILVEESDNDYQGDTFAIVVSPEDPDKFGFVHISWGSCSGCDALQACSSYQDVDDLAQGIEASVIWKNAASMVEYLCQAEARNEHYVSSWRGEDNTFKKMRKAALLMPVFQPFVQNNDST